MEFATLDVQCDPEVDPHCDQPCDSTAELCDTAESIDEPLEAGQIGVGDASATSEEAECPPTINGGIWFSWRRHGFVVWGTHVRQRVPRSWPWAEAEYALPPGPHESDDGEAVIWNGVLRGNCYGYIDRHGEFNGIISFTWVRGEAHEKTAFNGSGGGEGGEYYTVSDGTLTTTTNGVNTGDAEVDGVVNRWLDANQCTEGWVLIVDGVRVC